MVPHRGTQSLAEAIRALAHALDPQHQGECWPDPIAWDGRPLPEQARDLLTLAESRDSYYSSMQSLCETATAASAVRSALRQAGEA